MLLEDEDTALGGCFKSVDLTDPRAAAEKLRNSTRVMTTFAADRKGDMLDFRVEIA